MKIETKYHGELEIKQEDILTFEQGIPGFEEERKFILLPIEEENTFYILQSVKTKQLGFVVTNPFSFLSDYDFVVEEKYINQLQLQSEKDAAVFVIVTVAENFQESTANLQAPVLVNTRNNKAKQIILANTTYLTKHPLFQKTAK